MLQKNSYLVITGLFHFYIVTVTLATDTVLVDVMDEDPSWKQQISSSPPAFFPR